MKRCLTIIAIILSQLTLFRVTSYSQVTSQGLPAKWSLHDCIDYALKNNIQINLLRLDYLSKNEDLLQSRASKLPSLSGSVSETAINRKNAASTDNFQAGANFQSGYSLDASITLYNGGYIRNDIKSKELSLQSSNLYVQQAGNDITLSITQAFLNVLLAKENIVYIDDVLSTSRSQLKQAEQLYNAGSISYKDFLQFQAHVATDEYNLVNANNNYRQNIVVLKQILQLPSSADFQVATPDTLIVIKVMPSLAEAQQAAQQLRPEVKNGEVNIEFAQTELQKIRAGLRPTLTADAGLFSTYASNQSYKYLSQLNNNFYQLIGITLGIPIYSRRINKTNIEKSKILVQQAQLSLLDTKTILNQQVEQAYIDLQNAQAQYTAAETQLKISEESYKITNEQFNLGAINIYDMLQQRNQYIQAVQAYTAAKYMAVLQQKIYEFYMGNPVTL